LTLDGELGQREQFASDEVERAWRAEIQHRSAEFDTGAAELMDWTEVCYLVTGRYSSDGRPHIGHYSALISAS
jgi:hypothetical protein